MPRIDVHTATGRTLDCLVAKALGLSVQMSHDHLREVFKLDQWDEGRIEDQLKKTENFLCVVTSIGGFEPLAPYSTHVAYAWPLMEQENIFTYPSSALGNGYCASKWKLPVDVKLGNEFICKTDDAPTRLTAAMRCLVIARLGAQAELFEDLLCA